MPTKKQGHLFAKDPRNFRIDIRFIKEGLQILEDFCIHKTHRYFARLDKSPCKLIKEVVPTGKSVCTTSQYATRTRRAAQIL